MQAIVIGDVKETRDIITTIIRKNGFECGPENVWSSKELSDQQPSQRYQLIAIHSAVDGADAVSRLQQARKLFSEANIVLIGPAESPKFILQLLREGADEFVDQAELGSELEPTLVRVKSKGQSHDLGQVTAVIGASGGCGASTVAVNLASAWGNTDDPPVLVDLKLSSPDLSLLVDVKARYALDNLCDGYERMDAAMLQQAYVPHPNGFRLLAGPARYHQPHAISAEAVQKMLGLLQSTNHQTIFELDRSLGPEQVPVLRSANAIFLVMRLDMVSLHHTQQLLDRMDVLGVSTDHIHLVINGAGQAKELPVKRAEEVLQTQAFHIVPGDSGLANLCTNKGVALVREKPKSRIARSLSDFSDKAAGLMSPSESTAYEHGNRLWSMRRVAAI